MDHKRRFSDEPMTTDAKKIRLEKITSTSESKEKESQKDTKENDKQDLFQESLNELENDIHRTGAKCVLSGIQDMLEPGAKYHVTGALRIKPGRGDRTISMSCSDKIMKWCHIGLQGGLLFNIITEPIFLSSVILGSLNFCKDALCRALSSRGRDMPSIMANASKPVILRSCICFKDSKDSVEKRCNIDRKVNPAGVCK